MRSWKRRVAFYGIVFAAVIMGYTIVYHYGMIIFEDESTSIFHSFQIVVETFTATGFGSDAPWTSPEMNLLVVLMDITGVALIFLALPVFVFPLLEEALSTTVPSAVGEMNDHVVICSFTPRVETLISELESWNVGYVIVESNRERAETLFEDDYAVIFEDPESVEGLEAANLRSARAIVTDASDEVNTSIILTAKEVAESVRVISVVEDPAHETYHRLAGADTVLSPRSLLGESLATKVTTAVTAELGDSMEIGEDFELAEFPIHRGSELVGRTLAESGLRERAGVNVIGAWVQGQFESPPSPDATLDNGTILLVTGRGDQLERLKDVTLSARRQFGQGATIVAGYGEVGMTVCEALDADDVAYTVLDIVDKPGVDVVGDVTDPETLAAAGVDEAQTIVLTLPNDSITEFASLVIRDLNPSIEILARTEEPENVLKMYRAGADYALALATVTGRMLASAILEDEEVISFDKHVEVVRTQAPGLVGRTPREAQVRARTGCTIIGVERNGEVITNVGPDFRIEPGDEVIIAGTDDGTNRFTRLLSEPA